MDSDDQNACKKYGNDNGGDGDDDDDRLVAFNVRILDNINAQETQAHHNKKPYAVDNNGNSVVEGNILSGSTNGIVECNCVDFSSSAAVVAATTTTMSKKCARNANPTTNDNFIDDKLIRKLQSVSLSDDDYGEKKCSVCVALCMAAAAAAAATVVVVVVLSHFLSPTPAGMKEFFQFYFLLSLFLSLSLVCLLLLPVLPCTHARTYVYLCVSFFAPPSITGVSFSKSIDFHD
jgi:hypothetical protein